MKAVPRDQVLRRMQAENVWWSAGPRIHESYTTFRRRAYFKLFYPLVTETTVKRALLLMGPRRVGKTVLVHHAIQQLMEEGIHPRRICYVSVDHPIYTGCGLEDLLRLYREGSGAENPSETVHVFFDEIQYLKDWEVHLKSLVQIHPAVKFIASGSAAAALRLKSTESGAGRFTDFLLPPLTFHEYLDLLGKNDIVSYHGDEPGVPKPTDIHVLNREFLRYLNFGGYPEVIFSDKIQADPARFVKSDIIDKVLLRDLPGLYGIQDIQELNYLFTTLAFNTAGEISLEQLSQKSGVAKNTIKRYIEYLEAAFLLKVVHRIDRNARRFQRANFFKVYLTNPSMRSALFSPISEDDDAMGSLAETGIFSQWFHSAPRTAAPLYYARWNQGEVDIVTLGPKQKPLWAVEVKWTDRFAERPWELRSLIRFCRSNELRDMTVTTRTVFANHIVDGIRFRFVPASVYCYTVGYNIVRGNDFSGLPEDSPAIHS
jgi:uncharacterized protein